MIAALAALVAAQVAQPAHHYIQIYNFPEADSCATWTQYRAEKHEQILEGWVLGFVSGRNAFGSGGGDLAPGTNAAGLIGWVDQYCAANPLDSLSTAAFKLVDELQRRAKH